MRLTIAFVLVSIVAVAFMDGIEECNTNMDGKKCNGTEEDFAKCKVLQPPRTECYCPHGKTCNVQDNDGACVFSCDPTGEANDDGGADMGPGAGMLDKKP